MIFLSRASKLKKYSQHKLTKCVNRYPNYFHWFNSVVAVFVVIIIQRPKPVKELQQLGWR